MSKRHPAFILLSGFALTGLLFAAMGFESRAQQPDSPKSTASDSSCIYDFERGEVHDCIQKSADGELSIKKQVLKRLQFDSYGLAVVKSATNGWMYVSRKGKVVISGVPTMDNWADTFHDGLVRIVRNSKYGFSNRAGQVIVSPVYDGAMNFENGKARVCNGCTIKCADAKCEYHGFSGGEWFEIDTQGTVVSRIRAGN
jgi:hypothetical protein